VTQHDGSAARSTPGRLEYERAIRRSDLPPPSRHLALTIATWADIDTGVIADRFQPSMNTLLAATGMSKGSMLNHLNRLEVDGWIVRDRPDVKKARTEHARTHYFLAVPPWARGSDPLGLGQEMTQPRSGNDLAHGQEMTQGKVRSRPRARSGADPKSPYESRESQDSYSESESASSEQQAEPDPFDAFWSAYPRQVAKPKARQAWAKAIKHGANPADVVAAVTAHATAWGDASTETRFIPHPATWLNGERYNDEPDPPARKGRGPYQNPDDDDYDADPTDNRNTQDDFEGDLI
jgi:hypothetical protein